MSFLHPAAFAGLASILLLILLSFWRQRAARVVVPSVRLWERIPDRLPPVKSLRRPQASLSLLLQILVATALVISMAGPGVISERPAPRRIAVVVDLSASMGPRMEAARQELAKLDPTDDITLIESPSLVRRRGLAGDLKPIDRAGDPGPALDLAASEAKHVVFVSDRAPAWSPPPAVKLHLALVGGELDNTGIVDAGIEGRSLFVRLSRATEIEVVIGKEVIRPPSSAFHLVELPNDDSPITVSVGRDAFPADNEVVLRRDQARIDVGFEGRPDAMILAAIESNPRARVIRGGSPRLVIRNGPGATKVQAPFVVEVDPAEGVESWSPPGDLSSAKHPLTEGIDPADLKFAEVGKLAGTVEAAFLFNGAAPLAAVRRKGEIVLAARYAASGWPTRRSFPIFWANVLDYSASGLGAWRATGLLDEAASRPGLDRKPLDPGALEARPLAPRRTDLTAGSIALAALLLALVWLVESRPSGSA